MYSLQRGKETYVSLPRPSEGTVVSFTKGEIAGLVDKLLFRKERNNGVGRRLMSGLYVYSESGAFGAFSHTLQGTLSGFRVRRSLIFKDRYELVLFGDVDGLLARVNGRECLSAALAQTKREREERRKQPNRPREKVKKLRSLPGTGLHWHFRNHPLTYDDAVLLLAKASRKEVSWIRRKLSASLDERGVGSVRFEAGFVARIDLGYRYTGLLNVYERIELRTSDNNTSLIYRRLRMLLKAHFGCEPRARVEARALRTYRLCA